MQNYPKWRQFSGISIVFVFRKVPFKVRCGNVCSYDLL